MRLFIAVNFNNDVKNRIQKVQDELLSQVISGNYTIRENLHLTLVFLGETPENRIDVLIDILKKFKFSAVKLNFKTTGFFKQKSKELWWLGIDQYDPEVIKFLKEQERLRHELLTHQFSFDPKPLKVHITLARQIVKIKPVFINFNNIFIDVDRISLMKSERIKGKLIYTELFTVHC